MYFNQVGRCDLRHPELPANVFVTNPPGESLGFEDAVIEVRKSFFCTQEAQVVNLTEQ